MMIWMMMVDDDDVKDDDEFDVMTIFDISMQYD
jgi:hypothetical protein